MADAVILIAPDSFKGSLSAHEASHAMAAGIRRAWPEATLVLLPLSDGGDGLLDVVGASLQAESYEATVTGPDGGPRKVRWLYEPSCRRAWIAASDVVPLHAVGSGLVQRGTTRGVGELIRVAQAHGATQVTLGIGGTGTIDGGAGCLVGLGHVIRDSVGDPIDPGLASLAGVASIEPHGDPIPDIELLCDVHSPLLGDRGAAQLYGPQKGLLGPAVQAADRALASWSTTLDAAYGCDPGHLAFSGAGGGLAAALMAATAAVPRRGVARVAELLDLETALMTATLVVTGEGLVDAQSREGKVVGYVLALSAQHGRPVQVIAGRLAPGVEAWLAPLGARACASAPPGMDSTQCLTRARELVEAAAFEAFRGAA
jgi:glycerate kinase